MKVLHEWLQDYFEKPLPSSEELAELLTFHSFEIEGVEDGVIDVDVLPNRSSDCLSHRGIAREIGTLLDLPLKQDPLTHIAEGEKPESYLLRAEVEEGEICPRFSALVMRDVEVKESPAWLQKRLAALGQKSINNIVDATNYVMFNLGQPLHAFDLELLSEKNDRRNITVRRAKMGETITTLDEVERTLSADNQLITDGNSDTPISIAGIKGGLHSGVSEKTKHIVLEAANFNYQNIRKTSQELKLQTDASVRFQNDIVPELTTAALLEASKLIADIAGGESEGWVDVWSGAHTTHEPIEVTLEQINGLLGTTLNETQVEDILRRLGFSHTVENGVFQAVSPLERTDIRIREDVIEEAGRVFGYKNIVGKELPALEAGVAVNHRFYYAEVARDALIDAGFDEVYTYTLTDHGEVELLNSLASDKTHMRATLTEGIAKSLDLNEKNAPLLGVDAVRIFEIGPVFLTEGETHMLTLGARNLKGKQGVGSEELLAQAVAVLEEALGVAIKEQSDGEILEINFDALIVELPTPSAYEAHARRPVRKYRTISSYPFVLRDIAVWTPNTTTADDVRAIITQEAGELLITHKLFDVFEKDGRTSYAFNLVFQSHERTLSDVDVNEIMDRIVATLHKKEGFEVR